MDNSNFITGLAGPNNCNNHVDQPSTSSTEGHQAKRRRPGRPQGSKNKPITFKVDMSNTSVGDRRAQQQPRPKRGGARCMKVNKQDKTAAAQPWTSTGKGPGPGPGPGPAQPPLRQKFSWSFSPTTSSFSSSSSLTFPSSSSSTSSNKLVTYPDPTTNFHPSQTLGRTNWNVRGFRSSPLKPGPLETTYIDVSLLTLFPMSCIVYQLLTHNLQPALLSSKLYSVK